MSDYAAMIAAFEAKGGKVKVAAEGEGLGLTNYAWRKMAQDAPVYRPIHDDSESRAERAMEAFQGARMSGASMEVAMDEYNYARNTPLRR